MAVYACQLDEQFGVIDLQQQQDQNIEEGEGAIRRSQKEVQASVL